MRASPVFITAFLLTLPLTAAAERQTTLLFGEQSEQAQWNTIGLSGVTPLADGLRISTTRTATLSRPLALPHGIDVVMMTYTSPRGASPLLIWRKRGDPAEKYMQIPFVLKPSDGATTFTMDVSAVRGWDPRAVAIGLQLPPGTDILLHSIEFRGWGLAEKAVESLRCFWAFDGLKAHSINFFWGPLLCSTPVAREYLYRNQPPIAHSGMRTIYTLLGLGAALLAIRAWRKPGMSRRSTLITGLAALFLTAWIVLDIRMGAEILSVWTYDVRSYLLRPIGQRTFRTVNFLPDFAAASNSILSDQPRYVLLAPTTDTFMNFMRYHTYPSLPVSPAEGSGATIWLAYERPDLSIDTEGRIREKGEPLSPSGKIVHEFMPGTFIFRVTAPSSP